MILIDGNNLTRRILHVAVVESMKDFFKKDYNGELPSEAQMWDFKVTFLHLVLHEILEMKAKYGRTYGKVLIAFDSRNPWRKRVYSGYKAKRHDQSKRTPSEKMQDNIFYWVMPSLIEILKATDFKVLENLQTPDEYGIEADDIIGILAGISKSVIGSNDEDYTQLLSENVRQYHSTRRTLLETPPKKDIEMWKQYNLISGQSKDGIPGIMQHCKLSPEFMTWCKKVHDLEITGDMIEKIEKDHQALMTGYELAMKLEDDQLLLEGKRKIRRYLTAYEKPRGGEKMVLDFLNNFEANLKANPRWKAHYERNEQLLLFSKIPDDVKQVIIEEFKKEDKLFFDTITLQNLLLKNRLYNIEKRISEF